MFRYLLFDSSCVACTRLAHKICRESGDWIDEVLNLQSAKALELIDLAGYHTLTKPALVESTKSGVRIFVGTHFRLRLLLGLGASQAWRISRVIAGDLATAAHSVRDDGTINARRSVLRRIAILSFALSAATGIGFSTLVRSQTRKQEDWSGNLTQGLKDTSPQELSSAEKMAIWPEVKALTALERLRSQKTYRTMTGSDALNELLTRSTAPDDLYAERRVRNGETVATIVWLLTGQPTFRGETVLRVILIGGESTRDGHLVRIFQGFRTPLGKPARRTLAHATSSGGILMPKFSRPIRNGVRVDA